MNRIVAFALAAALLHGSARAEAPPLIASDVTLDKVLPQVVETIVKSVKKFGQPSRIDIRQFVHPNGNCCKQHRPLKDELGKNDFKFDNATVRLNGEYFELFDAEQRLEGYRVDYKLQSLGGTKERAEFRVHVMDRDAAKQIFGGNGQDGPGPDGDGKAPTGGPIVQDNIALPAKGSGYRAEVLVKGQTGFQRAPLTVKEKDFFVDLKKGDTFQIRVHNDYEYEAAVTVTIDGVSRFATATDSKLARNDKLADLVDPKSALEVAGWFINHEAVTEFLVGDYKDSVVAKYLPPSNEPGTIAIVFRAAWEKGKTPPPFEKQANIASGGVGQGGTLTNSTQKVEREKGRLRAQIRIRYDASK